MAIFAFIGYQSIKHGYYLLKYGESKEKVTANRAITLDVTSLPDQENSPE
jgi:hypothetical protein